MTSRKSPGACDAGAKKFESQKQPASHPEKSQTPQVRRLGESRRLTDGRWAQATPSTTMMAAFVKAAQTANAEKSRATPRAERPRQMLFSDFGVMEKIEIKKKPARRRSPASEAATPRAEHARQMYLSDFGIMPEITFTKKSKRRTRDE